MERELKGLYAIADAETLVRRGVGLRAFGEGLLAVGAEFAGNGVVQWRCKGGTPREVLEGAAVLREVFAGTGCRLILNDWAELVGEAGLDGLHVGQGDLRAEAARGLIGSGRLLGVSTHNPEQLRLAAEGPADYVAIGPVFSTETKADADPVVGLEGVRAARGLTRKPLVAIGGISAGNARGVIAAGADAVAVIGALLQPGRSVRDCALELLDAVRVAP